jgi:hypothetical protein
MANITEMKGNFELINGKFVNKNRAEVYEFFIEKMKNIGIHDYYLSMEPKPE